MRNKSQRSTWKAQDNKTVIEKARLRKQMLAKLQSPPVILETHGGTGDIFQRCYKHVEQGIVFETDPKKAAVLCRQRPNWTVCETDCNWALSNNVGSHLPINFIDCDPYGAAWNALNALFRSDRPRPDKVLIVVHDGIRNRITRFGASDIDVFHSIIEEIGEIALSQNYLDVCQHLLTQYAALGGYAVEMFGGFYSKHDKNQTHFFAELKMHI